MVAVALRSPPLRGLLSAVQFLTRVPVPRGNYGLEHALPWLPVVGLLLGAALSLADVALNWLAVPSLLGSVLLVVLLLVATGGLHADGLMDTCDAVFVHASAERRLEIMRDPRVGAFGVIGLLSVVLLKVASLEALPANLSRLGLLVLAPTLGRWAIVFLSTVFPYGRERGLGAPLKAAATVRLFATASLVPILACLVLGPLGVVLGVGVAVGVYAFGRWLLTLLPGLTGDCYGAGCELTEMLVWLTGAILAPRLLP